jgi:alcohol/geraniol dehydrogenase (NADP+)
MKTTIKAYAANAPGAPLQPFEYTVGPLGDEQVEIAVTQCGICHSDLSMWGNEWGMTVYPLVPGHEIVGEIVALGEQVKRVQVGQTVGLGWFSHSCMACPQCLSGDHNLCTTVEQTDRATARRIRDARSLPLAVGERIRS